MPSNTEGARGRLVGRRKDRFGRVVVLAELAVHGPAQVQVGVRAAATVRAKLGASEAQQHSPEALVSALDVVEDLRTQVSRQVWAGNRACVAVVVGRSCLADAARRAKECKAAVCTIRSLQPLALPDLATRRKNDRERDAAARDHEDPGEGHGCLRRAGLKAVPDHGAHKQDYKNK